MTYDELLKRGSLDEVAEALLDIVKRERNYRHKGFAKQDIRAALAEFYERGAVCGALHGALAVCDGAISVLEMRTKGTGI